MWGGREREEELLCRCHSRSHQADLLPQSVLWVQVQTTSNMDAASSRPTAALIVSD